MATRRTVLRSLLATAGVLGFVLTAGLVVLLAMLGGGDFLPWLLIPTFVSATLLTMAARSGR